MSQDGEVRQFPNRPIAAVGDQPDASQGPQGPGQLTVTITYLEMRDWTRAAVSLRRTDRLALLRAEQPTVSFYRYLYNTVGGPWLWYERRNMDDDALRAEICSPGVEIFVLYSGGVPAGFFELDRRIAGQVELKYFGLCPEFVGRGLGPYLLDRALGRAWSTGPCRVWLNTCSLDHPRAMALYQRAGFAPYKQERIVIDDPREQ